FVGGRFAATRHAAAVMSGLVLVTWLWTFGSMPLYAPAVLAAGCTGIGLAAWAGGLRRQRWIGAASCIAYGLVCGMTVLLLGHQIFMLSVDDLAAAGALGAVIFAGTSA